MTAIFLIAAGVVIVSAIPAYIIGNLFYKITHGSARV